MTGEPVDAVAAMQGEGAIDSAQLFGAVKVGDVAQFQAAFVATAGTAGAESVDRSAQTQRANVYNMMLNPLYEFRQNFDNIVANISDRVMGGNISMADLFSTQFELMQLGYMNDLSAKTADKLSQGLQTLFRNQG
ncbi:MAG: hypothetical protein LBD72_02720 [Puniceicoccales bacterium]|jgi:hypothetical protein|nr:hypothetical protein [Puniceicoccales bacterium]